jgi:hypothetical protein
MGYQQWDALTEITRSINAGDRPTAGTLILPGNIRAEVRDGELWLSPPLPPGEGWGEGKGR